MQAIIKQENQDVAIWLQKFMKENRTNLSKVCREHGLDYTKTYRAIQAEFIELEFLQEIAVFIGDGARIRAEFFVSLEDKTGKVMENLTLKFNGGREASTIE